MNITGTGNVRDSKWKVYFSRLSEATTTGTATATLPQLQSNATSIGDYTATVMSPGDSISFEVDVTNDGDYDALLSNVTINGTPTCKFGSDTTDTSAQDVCSNLTYSIKYKGGASLIANTDILHSKETQTLVVELKYANITNSNLLPTHDVDITGLGISLTYVQNGNAKVNGDGTTPRVDPYDYHIGDRIQVAGDESGDYYRVIADSNRNDDYVVALKEEPLTKHEMIDLIESTEIASELEKSNTNNNTVYLKSAYLYSDTCKSAGESSGCSPDYSISSIKQVVDVWSNSKFLNNEIKTVDGYGARLIKFDELTNNLGYKWTRISPTNEGWHSTSDTPTWAYYSGSSYWTMSQDDSLSRVWLVSSSGISSVHVSSWYYVRPVINVYKTAIQTNNG